MAVIPGYQAVGVASPSGRMNVARASGASPISGALEDLGAVVGNIAEKKYKEQTDLAVATAKNEYLRSSIDLANKVQDDPNYQGWQDTYDAATEAERARIGAQIQDPRARQYFDLEAQTESTRASVALAQKSRQRFEETKRVGLDQTLDENGKALLATDDKDAQSSLMTGTNQIIDALAADGTITGDQARAKKKAFVEGFAKNRADSMIPVARLDILQRGMKTDSTGRVTFEKNGTFADFIPDDQRMQMIKVAEAEMHGQAATAIAEQRERSEKAYKGYVDQIISDPRKLDIKAVAKDPNLSGEHGETLLRLYQEQMKKLAGGDGPDENKGPGFWNTYKSVMAPEGDPTRIRDPLEIYKLAGPGRPLTLLGADTLVRLQNQRAGSEAKGDFETQKIAKFFSAMHDEIARPYGSATPGGEDAFFKFYMDKTKALEAAKASGKSIDDLLYKDSPAYIGKDYESYRPKFDDETLDVKPPEASSSWLTFFGMGGGAGEKFSTQQLDKNVRAGAEGSAQGVAALKAAIAAGHITKDAASQYAIRRGWVRPSAPAAKPKPGSALPIVPPTVN